MGDLGPQIVSKMFSLNPTDFPHLRTWVMLCVTLFCILPLAMLKNVDSLSSVCAASIGFYICLVIKIVLESEEHIVTHDWVEKVEYWRPAGVLQCLPIFSMALSCQMQLFEVFESINNQSVEKLNGIVRNATWICTFVYIAVGFFGYVAFCTQTFSGNILMNFSPSFGSDVIKIGFVLSVAFSFPLVIFPCRASIYSLLYRKGHTDTSGYIPETRFKVITTCLVGCALGIALMIPSIELIIGLVGSTIGVAICIMFPAFCFRKIVKKDSFERSLAQFIFISGFCLMVLGTYANLHAIDEQRSGAHLHVAEELEVTNIVRATEAIKVIDLALSKSPRDKMRAESAHVGEEKLIYNPIESNVQQEKIKFDYLKDATPAKALPQAPIAANANNNEEKSKLPEKVIIENDGSLVNVMPLQVVPKKQDGEVFKLEEEIKKQPEKVAPSDIKPLPANPLPSEQPQPEQQQEINESPSNSLLQKQQQTIDKEAIKKDEEIAAEELKNGQKASKSSSDVELKETRKELKQTKELLERTVDQLKHELAKQNEETQNLVAEKLERVVQKVEQIEMKVQNKESVQFSAQEIKMNGDLSKQLNMPADKAKEKAKVDMPNMAAASIRSDERPSLLSILSEQQADTRDKEKVYEPLSYKAGELIEKVKNESKLEPLLPLPLAVLFNASNVNTKGLSNKQTREVLENQLIKSNQHTTGNKNVTIDSKAENATQVKPLEPRIVQNAHTSDEKEKENVDAIRRDILQVKSESSKKYPIFGVTAGDTENDTINAEHVRRKRSNQTPNLDNINSKLQSDNCLTEPKVGDLLAHGGLSSAINLETQAIGRELRSVRDEN
ncbi:putative sodium-coupled neutral amino acid transporter 10 isoform X2 [Ceratitis capitata]|nr:putative sodium-coupled neutral amino acid transporter 10 isoform X2 [Ceratitis capitata]CAD7014319.1 unnamed protein product [Ceratitis capitata]